MSTPAHKPDKATVDAMHAEGLSYEKIAKRLSSNYSAVRRVALSRLPNGAPASAPQSAPTESVPHERNGSDERCGDLNRQHGGNGRMAKLKKTMRDPWQQREVLKDVVNLAFHEFFGRRQYLPEAEL